MPAKPARVNISVVIPAFNAELFLAECVASIRAQFSGEILVVNNASSDGTAALASSLGARVIDQPTPGLAPTLNFGYTRLESDWIASCDADDLWVPGKLAAQLSCLKADPELDMIFTWLEQFGAVTDLPTSPSPHRGTMLVRRSAFERVGLFDESLKLGEFVDWYSRARTSGLREAMVPEVLYRRRIHSDNMGLRDRAERKDYLRLLKSHLDRKRARS